MPSAKPYPFPTSRGIYHAPFIARLIKTGLTGLFRIEELELIPLESFGVNTG